MSDVNKKFTHDRGEDSIVQPYKAGNDAIKLLREIYEVERDDEGDTILFKEFRWRKRIKKILDEEEEP